MATPLMAGLSVAAAAYMGRQAILAYVRFQASPPVLKAFYKGGFQPEMNKREACLILGLRDSAADDKIKDAHRRIMIANHPDAGGSSYIAAKVNDARDIMMGKKKSGVF